VIAKQAIKTGNRYLRWRRADHGGQGGFQMVDFVFHPDAELEFNESIDYYESCSTGLGYDFSLEVLSPIEAIIPQPLAWPVVALFSR
jgi:hypothetical protein